jgi:tetratricopeptide (TPR) repeat protein
MHVQQQRPGSGDNGDAEALKRLRRARPDDAQEVFSAAASSLNRNLEDEAVPLLRAATERHPSDPRMWQLLGLALRGLGDLEDAVACLNRAASLKPDDALIVHAYARARLEAGLPAIEEFKAALKLAPLDSQLILGLAAARFAQGDAAGAVAFLDGQLRQHPGWFEGHDTASRLRWMSGDRESFTASLEEALGRSPRDGQLWRELIRLLLKAEKFNEALAAIGHARACVGKSRTLDQLEALAVSELGDIAHGDRLYGALLPFADGALAVHFVRHLLRAGRPTEAAACVLEWQQREQRDDLWPYLSIAWRLTGDPRWQWLEGDSRFVGIYDLGEAAGALETLAERLRGLHLASQQPLDQSLRGGTQTDGPLFSRTDPEIRRLRAAVEEAVGKYISNLPPHDAAHPLLRQQRERIRFAGSWSVRLTGEGRHVNHVHPAGWISSAFYVALPASVGGPGKAGWLTLGEATELGIELPPIVEIEPKPGRLVLFPSTMWHGTRPFPEGERLTVAFDIARL